LDSSRIIQKITTFFEKTIVVELLNLKKYLSEGQGWTQGIFGRCLTVSVHPGVPAKTKAS